VVVIAHVFEVIDSVGERIAIDVVTYHSYGRLGDEPVHKDEKLPSSMAVFADGVFATKRMVGGPAMLEQVNVKTGVNLADGTI